MKKHFPAVMLAVMCFAMGARFAIALYTGERTLADLAFSTPFFMVAAAVLYTQLLEVCE
jgi:steroid 5-alpha reductase family enzyme